MSEFSRDIRDYIRFDEYDIEERFGNEALRAVMDEAQNQLDQLTDAFDYADSDSEREFAVEQIGDFQFGDFDAENIAEDYEFSFLQDYMSQSKKSDYDLINRYVELVGYGGGGGGGGGFTPTPTPPADEIAEIEEAVDDAFEFEDLDYIDDYEELDEYLEDIDFSFFDLLDIESEIADQIGSFFDEFF